jgi:DNA-binding transcriptional LysR family regulator
MLAETLRDMVLFTRVVRAGSLSAAGRELGLSPASVSRRVSSLEDGLGVRLLNRTSRRMTLTDAGGLLLERAEELIRQADSTREEVASFQRVPQGLLRVRATMAIGSYSVAPMLPSFLKKYPGVSVELSITQDSAVLVDRDVDVAIRLGRQPDTSQAARRLASIPRVVCASPEYLATHAEVHVPEDLAAHNSLTFKHDAMQPVWNFSGPGGNCAVKLKGTLRSNTVEPLRLAALASIGVTMLPEWWIREDLANGSLRALLPEWTASGSSPDYNVYAVWQKGRHLPPKVRAFVDFLVESLHQPFPHSPSSE